MPITPNLPQNFMFCFIFYQGNQIGCRDAAAFINSPWETGVMRAQVTDS